MTTEQTATRYLVAVIEPNTWDASTGVHPISRSTGVHHRSIAAAMRSKNALTASDKHGNCRADFYGAQVIREDRQPFTDVEIDQLHDFEAGR